jgi:hypothetical protein
MGQDKETAMTFVATLLVAFAAQDADHIQDLIRKLGSDDFTTREQATEELKKAGKSARESLQKAADESDDPEVRQRAKTILEEMAKAPAPRRNAPAPAPPGIPGRPGFRGGGGGMVTVKSVNGDTTYTITPNDGSAVLNFYKAAGGSVKLDTKDESGAAKSVEAANLDTFLKENKELAQKFGITEDGIEYAGSRVSFKGQLMPGFPRFNFPQRPGRVPPPPAPAPVPDEEAEGTPVAGAVLGPVDDSLRAQLDIPEGQGAVVSRVERGSVAESLGLRRNDVILELDGKKIASPAAAKGRLTKDSTAVVLRKGKRETLGVKRDY